MSRFDVDPDADFGARAGLSGFLRSLLDGIPWSERATVEEELEVDAPRGPTLS